MANEQFEHRFKILVAHESKYEFINNKKGDDNGRNKFQLMITNPSLFKMQFAKNEELPTDDALKMEY